MPDQNLFLPICGPLLFLLVLVTAILGMRARFRFVQRLRNAYNDQERIDSWLKTHKNKQRILLLTSLISILGVLLLGSLTLSGLLLMSKILLIVFAILFFLGILSGILILIDLEKLAK